MRVIQPDMAAPTSGVSVRRTLVGAACMAAQPLLLSALSVPATAYIIHRMGSERYAHWVSATALIAVFALIANLGLRSAYVRTVAADPARVAEALAEQLGLRLALTVPAGVLALLACVIMGYPAPAVQCVFIGVVGLVLTTAATTLADTLQSCHRLKTLAGVNLAAGLSLTGLSIVVAWWKASPQWMAAAYLAGPCVSCVLFGALVWRHICRVSVRWAPERFLRLLKDSRFFAAQQLLVTGSNQAEGLLAPRLLGMQAFGGFAAGATLGNRLVVVPDALCAAAFPAMVRAWRQGRPAGAALVQRYLLIAIGGAVALALCACAVARPLGELLLPDEAAHFATVVRVTIWSLPLVSAEFVLGYGLNAAGRESDQARVALPAALLTVATSVVLIAAMGVEGACWSMVARPAIRAALLLPSAVRIFWARNETAPASGVMPPLARAG